MQPFLSDEFPPDDFLFLPFDRDQCTYGSSGMKVANLPDGSLLFQVETPEVGDYYADQYATSTWKLSPDEAVVFRSRGFPGLRARNRFASLSGG